MGILREDVCTFMIILRRILLRVRNARKETWRENQNTFYVQYFFSLQSCLLWDDVENMVQPDRPQMIM